MAAPRKILVLFAHPALEKSRTNRRLILPVQNLSDVTFHDLYESYPDLLIDVKQEQDLLRAHDLIVLHHPLYWYSSPAILKEWQDVVLDWGFAYGEGGDALHGKSIMNAITTGGSREAYHPQGGNRFHIRQLLAPFDQMAHLCGMLYLPPFVVHGTHRLEPHDVESWALRYRRLILALRDREISDEALQELARIPIHEMPCINDLPALSEAATETPERPAEVDHAH